MLFYAGMASAFDFRRGDFYGSFDTTTSYGQTYRTQSQAHELIGIANGGTAYSVNSDDGDLNYDTGLVSSTFKFTSDLELHYKNVGAFARATGFKDMENDGAGDTVRTPLSDEAIELVGEDLKLLDAYVWADLNLGKMPFDIRVGKQVLSWGESTFIQNSINTINPVDVSKLRVPGAELKEALLPVGMVSAALGLTQNLTLEGFYEYDYRRVLIDPPGSYFSTNDFVGNGGNCVVLGFGLAPDYPLLPLGDATSTCQFAPTQALSASRSPDVRPDEGGQYGAALRWFVSALNDTEFGFYFLNYHSRLPIINAVSATPLAPGVVSPPFNNPFSPATYFISYPEDIQLYGVSFNTQLGTTGWALQGEYSFHDGLPLQVDDVEILTAALHYDLFGAPFASQLGTFGFGTVVPGFIRRDVSQLQMTASRVFGPMLKASQAIVVGEFAVTHVHDMPDKTTLRLDAPGTNLSGNPFLSLLTGLPVESNGFADATSWGYRIVGRLDYYNVIGSINLSPRVEWRHDVSGNSPGPGGNFIEGNKVITVGVGASYQHAWQADVSYTNFFGADSQNLLQDRDFLAFSLSYSF
jgi:hypothetical protein